MATMFNTLPARRVVRPFDAVFNQLFNDTLPGFATGTGFMPAADVFETAAGFELQLTLPGVAKEALTIDVQEGFLTVSGERKAPVTEGENAVKVRRAESSYGTFSRKFRLPETVNANAIQAELTDGVLRLTLPFDTDKTTKRLIEVR
ncbi:Hsp20/alpha crystallin family protein [Hymenobacter sp. 15J16-1T3B]|uniref:Hsp20/alpha crystallin family protein n=1 Tax=Hymenobacter sp. 15J16-1T3B TaxID=2886941 RepID=UPI001D11F2F8|nr:Hsp20/alpha crystallin family protein [Hymenobacter sp. 15J16-1T3B]MCC3157681.1 Hsp20/alpha crystallin family protein [Hymenobacter sp. 15J16-1T3B]